MIIYFCVFWNHINGTPFIKKNIPITSQLGDVTLMNYIREEIVNAFPSTEYDDGDIQFIKSGAGVNAIRMLPLTASMYIYTIKNDDPKQLNVAIHRSIQCKPVKDALAKITAATRPKIIKYKSKWGMNDVV